MARDYIIPRYSLVKFTGRLYLSVQFYIPEGGKVNGFLLFIIGIVVGWAGHYVYSLRITVTKLKREIDKLKGKEAEK